MDSHRVGCLCCRVLPHLGGRSNAERRRTASCARSSKKRICISQNTLPVLLGSYIHWMRAGGQVIYYRQQPLTLLHTIFNPLCHPSSTNNQNYRAHSSTDQSTGFQDVIATLYLMQSDSATVLDHSSIYSICTITNATPCNQLHNICINIP